MGTHQSRHSKYRRSADRARIAVERERVMRRVARQQSTHTWGAAARRPSHRLVPMEDYILALGELPTAVREELALTHVEYGGGPRGGVIWFPKEVADAA